MCKAGSRRARWRRPGGSAWASSRRQQPCSERPTRVHQQLICLGRDHSCWPLASNGRVCSQIRDFAGSEVPPVLPHVRGFSRACSGSFRHILPRQFLMLLSALRAHMPRTVAGGVPKRGRQAARAATAAAIASPSDAVRPKRRRASAASAAHVKADPDLHGAPGSSMQAAEEVASREQARAGAEQAAGVKAEQEQKAAAKPKRRRKKAENDAADKADAGLAPEPILLASPQVLARKWVSGV